MVDSITFMIFAVFDVLLVVNIVYKLQGGAKKRGHPISLQIF